MTWCVTNEIFTAGVVKKYLMNGGGGVYKNNGNLPFDFGIASIAVNK